MRFKDALVRITWGTPCLLEANFEIVSDRKDPALVEIGFPVGRYDPAYNNFDYAAQKRMVREEDCREAVSNSVFALEVNSEPLPTFRRVTIPGQWQSGVATPHGTSPT